MLLNNETKLYFTSQGEERLVRECAAIAQDFDEETPDETILLFARLTFTKEDVEKAANRILLHCVDHNVSMSNNQAVAIAMASLGAVGKIARNVSE